MAKFNQIREIGSLEELAVMGLLQAVSREFMEEAPRIDAPLNIWVRTKRTYAIMRECSTRAAYRIYEECWEYLKGGEIDKFRKCSGRIIREEELKCLDRIMDELTGHIERTRDKVRRMIEEEEIRLAYVPP